MALSAAVAQEPHAIEWHVVFEYELPRERGRRPEVVVLTGSQVIVPEFKDADRPQLAHIDQVAAYARDLSEYHTASHDKLVDPVLVLARSPDEEPSSSDSRGEPPARLDPREQRPSLYEVTITGPATLTDVLLALVARGPAEPLDAEAWLTVAYLERVATEARENGELHLALVRGRRMVCSMLFSKGQLVAA